MSPLSVSVLYWCLDPSVLGISFVRSGTTAEEQAPAAVANPDEINLDADYSSDEEEESKEVGPSSPNYTM